ncbi:hypothetical protein JXI42_07995 [bacterium]|nr:hypothetical protein [bacterium]
MFRVITIAIMLVLLMVQAVLPYEAIIRANRYKKEDKGIWIKVSLLNGEDYLAELVAVDDSTIYLTRENFDRDLYAIEMRINDVKNIHFFDRKTFWSGVKYGALLGAGLGAIMMVFVIIDASKETDPLFAGLILLGVLAATPVVLLISGAVGALSGGISGATKAKDSITVFLLSEQEVENLMIELKTVSRYNSLPPYYKTLPVISSGVYNRDPVEMKDDTEMEEMQNKVYDEY